MTCPHSPPPFPRIPRLISSPIAFPHRTVAITATTAWASRQLMALHLYAMARTVLRTTVIQRSLRPCPTLRLIPIISPPRDQPRNWEVIALQNLASILIPFRRSIVTQCGPKPSHKRPPPAVSSIRGLSQSSLTSLARVPHVDLARYVCESFFR